MVDLLRARSDLGRLKDGAFRSWRGRIGHADAVVERLFQQLTGFEVQHAALSDGDGLASLGIAPLPLSLVSQHEISKAGDLDLLSATQRFLHRLEHEVDEVRGFFLRKPSQTGVDGLNDFSLGHGRPTRRPSRNIEGQPSQLLPGRFQKSIRKPSALSRGVWGPGPKHSNLEGL